MSRNTRADAASTLVGSRDNSPATKSLGAQPRRRNAQRFRLKQDYRGRLPLYLSRFLGYRPPGTSPPYEPLPFLSFLRRIPIKWEVASFSALGAFVSILLVEALCMTSTRFRNAYHAPIIVASFGASAVLAFAVIESPLSQPRNLIGGHVISAIVGVAITRLFALDHSYLASLHNEQFHGNVFINGALCMSIALFCMFMTGTIHPPAGATALIAATSFEITAMSWKFIPVVLCSALVMFAWALIINNLGRRRYPIYWWSPERTFVVDQAPEPREDEEIALGTGQDNVLRRAEDGGRTAEAMKEDILQGRGGSPEAIGRALSRDSALSNQSGRIRRKSIS